RANKALEKANELHRIELNAEEIAAIEPQLHELYLKVVGDVGFNLFYLSPVYFSTIKRSLEEKFRLWIYRNKKDELISFFTVIEDGHILDAHFLGYDPKVNEEFKLYMNMLLRIIELATEKGFTRLQLSRTATEIKSSVGAEGIPMWAYLRLRNRFFNSLLPKVYSFFKPDLSWEARHPFR
ncbi:MAG TPA: GNAT family N-acetyltransferase, partial [Saprospiraceae bacterium]|nr:GNAT family N-acetyltransferase [Saprospiraceae bacterium]